MRYSDVMARKCPDDGGELQVRNIHGIEVDLCPRCGGLWLDKGEIVRLRKLKEQEVKDFELTPLQPTQNHPQTMACPICAKALQPFQYANGKATLTTCADLHGIWIPTAELGKIAGMHNPHPAAKEAAGLQGILTGESIDHITRAGQVLSILNTKYYGRPWGFF
jgi:Zn-finger nucleic acid-binding protein